MVIVIVGGSTTAAAAGRVQGLLLPLTTLLGEPGVDLVVVLDLGVDVVGGDVGVGVLVDVRGTVGWLEETLPRPTSKAVLADLPDLKNLFKI